MSNERPALKEWICSTPCSACGAPIRVDCDPCTGKKPSSAIAPSVRATCKACGHAEEYSASASDHWLR